MRSRFVRRKGDEPQREFRFLRQLERIATSYLPKKTLGRNHKSQPVRLRPELLDVIDALRDQYEVNEKVRLTSAEVIAAALEEAVPRMTAKKFSRPRAKTSALDSAEE
jgi:hypothetical protein